ncbi:hypothetical protein [Dactylosporangium sp. CS-033363]|uniref:phosphotransferase family protein n=1 Tax=Dactylosporangium sp. CS-033363 TaxID=3239935 RepID=UPI003D8BA340
MAQTHQLQVDGGRLTKRYVSWSRGEHRREWAVLRRVHDRHPDLVPEPLDADLDADPPTIAMSLLPGTPLPGGSDTDPQTAPATALDANRRAALHGGLDVDRRAALDGGPDADRRAALDGGLDLDRRAALNDGLDAGRRDEALNGGLGVDRQAALPGGLDAARRAALNSGPGVHQQAALSDALRRLWSTPCGDLPPRRDHPAELPAVMAERMAGLELPGRAGEAAHAARSFLAGLRLGPARTTVLGHGDPNLANYLWDGQRIRIVDFEDAGRSDPEFEMADLVEHVGARGADWAGFLARFDLDGDRLLDARRLFATFWLHLLRPGGPAERRNPPGSLDRQAERLLDLLS